MRTGTSFYWRGLRDTVAIGRAIREVRRRPGVQDAEAAQQPMTPELREAVYFRYNGTRRLTPRQRRRQEHKIRRLERRANSQE